MTTTARALGRDPLAAAANERAIAPDRVLLIEDELGIVDFLRRGLADEGFSVEACLDGRQDAGNFIHRSLDEVRCTTTF